MKTYKDISGDGGSNIVEQLTEQANRVKLRMAAVRHIIAIMSGKGGVGKSSLTVNLAAAIVALLALRVLARPANDEFTFGFSKIEYF